jgi:glycerol uptake facilitator protein
LTGTAGSRKVRRSDDKPYTGLGVNDDLGKFFGTMILNILGDGVVAGILLNRSKAQNGGWMAVTAAWAFGVLIGILTAKAIGAKGYINPVGPLIDAMYGGLPAEKAIGTAPAKSSGLSPGPCSSGCTVFHTGPKRRNPR